MCKPPEGCDYCAPQQAQCQPGDNYCRPPPSGECGQKMQGLRSQMEEMFRSFQTAMESFHQTFESDRRGFSGSQHTPEEWQAWNDGWQSKGKAIGDGFMSKWDSFIDSNGLGACKDSMPPPPMMGGHGGSGGPPPQRQYNQAPPQDNQYYQKENEGRELMTACMNEAGYGPAQAAQQGQGPPPGGQPRQGGSGSQAPPQGGQTGPGRDGPPPQHSMENPEFRAAMKACQEKLRGHFEEFYSKDAKPKDRKDEFGSFQMFEDAGTISVTGKYLALTGDPNSQQMTDITCGGQAFLDKLYVNGFLEDFGFDQTGEGTALRVKSSGVKILELHDAPRCSINVATGATVDAITLDLSDYLDVTEDDKGVAFTDGKVDGRILLADGTLDLSGTVVTIKGKATFFVSNSAASKASSSSLAQDLNIKAALEDGSIGAEVVIALDGDEVASDATPYGDLTVDVTKHEEGNGVDAIVENADHEGKTVVLSFAKDIFDTLDLEIAVTPVESAVATNETTDEAEAKEEACTQEADDLQDVLDPTNDGNCDEYWVVQDKHGVQTLVSVHHFSAKKISISSNADKKGLPDVGPVGAIVASIVAVVAIGIGLKRRKDE